MCETSKIAIYLFAFTLQLAAISCREAFAFFTRF